MPAALRATSTGLLILLMGVVLGVIALVTVITSAASGSSSHHGAPTVDVAQPYGVVWNHK